jgi:peptidoglycan/LPS O-acetylase OafA/YrhL
MLGGLTYPLYLLHQNVGYLAIDALAPTAGKWMALAIVVNAMLCASYLIWRYVETPARRRIVAALSGRRSERTLEAVTR